MRKIISGIFAASALLAGVTFASLPSAAAGPEQVADANSGVVRVASRYTLPETISKLKADIASKGIMFFTEIDQADLGRKAGLDVKPSTLLIFGNPPLGVQFLTSNPSAGLDWPVRLLVTEDGKGQVWVAYTDFQWIARRHHIKDRDAAFKMASEVIASITSSVR